jgi:hypothetical protein
MEPQRRFQDGTLVCLRRSCIDAIMLTEEIMLVRAADTVGKQEPFDWGWGWVAVRAVCWSPFDVNLFATTGNVSLLALLFVGVSH